MGDLYSLRKERDYLSRESTRKNMDKREWEIRYLKILEDIYREEQKLRGRPAPKRRNHRDNKPYPD
ncbi:MULTISPECIES: hypothetical protein [Aminobacterium]|jgi:hypothetical protein|uniref:Uncharacterized protein n=1 Tax=Aminobacterium colombiense (strain DSM 12261 / ALA-1) TaxID=572547 RepID=D5EHE5_AMICL|nr:MULTISPECIES: hypothetical protein [Aminobacterium]MDD2379528.1 hypothetical protein [Aminobacterium colombiense]ADE57977.1 hypothetical protein Amico_1864 [Aminobacterium colombiense DSM 12261]MDD3768026.1 hypothetical protein [Aminobacterium colombiense]MDD4266269.1 hypothetical protein [Aminobacterium colombiense]MDD4585225.1 hypothetical protein [Aminobacterium colombiense]